MAENEAKISYTFDLVDADTVTYIQSKNPNLLPYKVVNGKKEERWDKKVLNSTILRSIQSGAPIRDIAKDLRKAESRMSETAVTNARTMTTSAENAGREESMMYAQARWNITIRKRWLSTIDSRTRDSHIAMDGEIVEANKKYSNGLRYPADPNGAPEEVYNCRCTEFEVVDGVNYDNIERPNKSGMSYEEWKLGAKARKEEETKSAPKEKIDRVKKELLAERLWRVGDETYSYKAISQAENDFVNNMQGIILNSLDSMDEDMLDVVYDTLANAPINIISWNNTSSYTSYYSSTSNKIAFYVKDRSEESIVNTFWHEFGHYMDASGVINPTNIPKKRFTSYISYALDNNQSYVEAKKADIDNLISMLGLSDKFYTKIATGKKGGEAVRSYINIIDSTTKKKVEAYYNDVTAELIKQLENDIKKEGVPEGVRWQHFGWEKMGHVTDVLDSFTEGQLKAQWFTGGHSAEYYKGTYGKEYYATLEVTANMISVNATLNSYQAKMMKKYAPNTYKIVTEVLKKK